MKMTAWFFCSLLLVSVSLAQAEAPETQKMTATSSDVDEIGDGDEIGDDDVFEDDDEGLTAVERGKKLHNENCVRCHGSELYTRSNRRIRTYAGLSIHVQRCATNLNKQWFEDEVADVADYLDAEFYFFKTPKK